MARFVKGQSGNPKGRPKKRRPNVSAFDIIFDKRLLVMQDGKERELTIDEALQLKTYQDAIGGSRLAVRSVLKMIEKRERALQRLAPPTPAKLFPMQFGHSSDSADEAMQLLGILCRNPDYPDEKGPRPWVVNTWAAQAAISRPGRRTIDHTRRENLPFFIKDYDRLRLPRGSRS